MAKPLLVIKKELKAPPHLVFNAWSKPKLLMKWAFPFQNWKSSTQSEFKVGGHFTHKVTDVDGTDHTHAGKYLEIIENQKIVFTWNVRDDEETLISVVITVLEGDTTEISLTHEYFPNEELRNRYYETWNNCMNNLEKFLAGED